MNVTAYRRLSGELIFVPDDPDNIDYRRAQQGFLVNLDADFEPLPGEVQRVYDLEHTDNFQGEA